MANERIKAQRAVPRQLARNFAEDKYMTLALAGLLFSVVMGAFSIAQGLLSTGMDVAIATVLTAITVLGGMFVAVRLVKFRQGQQNKQAEKASKACLVYAILLVMSALFMGNMYFTTYTFMQSGEAGELAREMEGVWQSALIFGAFETVTAVFQAASYFMLYLVFKGMQQMSVGRYPEKNRLTASSMVCSLTAGLVICYIMLKVMMASGDAVSMVSGVISSLPDLLFYFSMSQLCRLTSLRLRGEEL